MATSSKLYLLSVKHYTRYSTFYQWLVIQQPRELNTQRDVSRRAVQEDFSWQLTMRAIVRPCQQTSHHPSFIDQAMAETCPWLIHQQIATESCGSSFDPHILTTIADATIAGFEVVTPPFQAALGDVSRTALGECMHSRCIRRQTCIWKCVVWVSEGLVITCGVVSKRREEGTARRFHQI
jgi:hypothetical protein